MLEYGIYNLRTDEEMVIYGYNFDNACKRAGLNPEEWQIIYREYVD